MNIVFTCGGTGGHINPAIAVANIWKEQNPDSKILFIGAKDRMEEELVPKAGYKLHTIPAMGMSREFTFAGIKRNAQAIWCVLRSVGNCKKVLREFGADVVVGTGGYASFPALLAATMLKIPTCVHEANAMPGLTTRMIADRVDRVLTCFPESAKYYKHPDKVETVGMPVRREFIFTKQADARKEMGLDERPVIVTAFGSQGAKAMNEAVLQLFELEKAAGYPFQHIHATGSYGWQWMSEAVREKGISTDGSQGITMQEYIYNMPTVMAAADVIISRAGASSCNEIAASGTPCILIPSPNVTDNHQEKNARALSDNGAAVLVLEKDCTAQLLMTEITALLQDHERNSQMRKALQKICVVDSAQKLCDIIKQLASSR
ncbi:MAG: undecaprenyldiphospho-muramoylpentapeptide beta-N-acetylglucosaminyltransferase [Oscillospiraceae bacterium]|nr:undecaprenyldiphospho-muramoylpentapeptide beta-N-acetylglucosaminyltransferase [Oscillospiraceae bacterium]